MTWPDSSTKSTSLLVEYDREFNIQNWWVEGPKPALGNYYSSLYNNILKEGKQIIVPVTHVVTYPNPAYNLAVYHLSDKHRLQFDSLLPFYEPREKQKILGTKMYNFFSDRSILRIRDTLHVIYDMMPFVYGEKNQITDTLHVKPNLFVGDPDFRAMRDSANTADGSFRIPYSHNITSYGDSFIVVAREFENVSVALYNSDFNLLSKAYFPNAAYKFFPKVWNDKLVYMKRWPEIKGPYYIYEMNLSDVLPSFK